MGSYLGIDEVALSQDELYTTIQTHYLNIINYFDDRSTNATSEFLMRRLKCLENNLEVLKKSFLLV